MSVALGGETGSLIFPSSFLSCLRLMPAGFYPCSWNSEKMSVRLCLFSHLIHAKNRFPPEAVNWPRFASKFGLGSVNDSLQLRYIHLPGWKTIWEVLSKSRYLPRTRAYRFRTIETKSNSLVHPLVSCYPILRTLSGRSKNIVTQPRVLVWVLAC